jgi:hypothetical protein
MFLFKLSQLEMNNAVHKENDSGEETTNLFEKRKVIVTIIAF